MQVQATTPRAAQSYRPPAAMAKGNASPFAKAMEEAQAPDASKPKKNGWLWSFGPGVTAQVEMNFDSLGDKTLTPEQIQDLRNRYDLGNLTGQENYNLLAELTQLGVITADDALKTRFEIHHFSNPVYHENGIITEGDGLYATRLDEMHVWEKESPFQTLLRMLEREKFSYQYFLDNHDTELLDTKASIESHQRVVDVLTKLARDPEDTRARWTPSEGRFLF